MNFGPPLKKDIQAYKSGGISSLITDSGEDLFPEILKSQYTITLKMNEIAEKLSMDRDKLEDIFVAFNPILNAEKDEQIKKFLISSLSVSDPFGSYRKREEVIKNFNDERKELKRAVRSYYEEKFWTSPEDKNTISFSLLFTRFKVVPKQNIISDIFERIKLSPSLPIIFFDDVFKIQKDFLGEIPNAERNCIFIMKEEKLIPGFFEKDGSISIEINLEKEKIKDIFEEALGSCSVKILCNSFSIDLGKIHPDIRVLKDIIGVKLGNIFILNERIKGLVFRMRNMREIIKQISFIFDNRGGNTRRARIIAREIPARLTGENMREIISKIMYYYNKHKREIVEEYSKYFHFELEEKLISTESSVQVRRLAPDVFPPRYTRICPKPPIIVEKDEDLTIRFPIDGSSVERIYKCPYEKEIYPGFKKNTLENKDKFPFLICCYTSDQMEKPGSTMRGYYKNESVKEKKERKQTNFSSRRSLQDGSSALYDFGLFQTIRIGVSGDLFEILSRITRKTPSRTDLSFEASLQENLQFLPLSELDILAHCNSLEWIFNTNILIISGDKFIVPPHQNFFSWTIRNSVVILRLLEDSIEYIPATKEQSQEALKLFSLMTRQYNKQGEIRNFILPFNLLSQNINIIGKTRSLKINWRGKEFSVVVEPQRPYPVIIEKEIFQSDLSEEDFIEFCKEYSCENLSGRKEGERIWSLCCFFKGMFLEIPTDTEKTGKIPYSEEKIKSLKPPNLGCIEIYKNKAKTIRWLNTSSDEKAVEYRKRSLLRDKVVISSLKTDDILLPNTAIWSVGKNIATEIPKQGENPYFLLFLGFIYVAQNASSFQDLNEIIFNWETRRINIGSSSVQVQESSYDEEIWGNIFDEYKEKEYAVDMTIYILRNKLISLIHRGKTKSIGLIHENGFTALLK